MKQFVNEFKQFLARGNVMDLAVGVIIGGAFKSIVDSLTKDILMPLLVALTGKISFGDLSVTVGSAVLTYGNFIQAILNFLIMAFAVFLLVKGVNLFHKKKEAVPPAPPAPAAPSKEELLLGEIRDLLKAQQSK